MRLRQKHRKSKKRGVPDPPYCCQSGVLSPRSEYMPLTLSSVSSSSSLWEYKSQTKHVNTCSYYFRAPATVELRVMGPHHIDRGRLYELNSVRNYYFMWSICWDIKCTCICSSAWPNLLSSAHITTDIFVLSFIIHLYTAHAQLAALKNTIYLGVLFLTFVCGISCLAMKESLNWQLRQCAMLGKCIIGHYNLF